MALDDQDRADIASMIQQAVTSTRPARAAGAPAEQGGRARARSDWDGMSGNDQRLFMRDIVDERLSELDKDYDLQETKARNKELAARVQELEAGGKKSRRPAAGAGPVPGRATQEEEKAPTVFTRAYVALFGQPPTRAEQ